jgi:hypothetical protein
MGWLVLIQWIFRRFTYQLLSNKVSRKKYQAVSFNKIEAFASILFFAIMRICSV